MIKRGCVWEGQIGGGKVVVLDKVFGTVTFMDEFCFQASMTEQFFLTNYKFTGFKSNLRILFDERNFTEVKDG